VERRQESLYIFRFLLFSVFHFSFLCFRCLGLDGDFAGALLLGHTLVGGLVGSTLDSGVAAEGSLDEVLALSANLSLDGSGASTEALIHSR